MQSHVLTAVVKKELAGYFSSPVGYVFITLFVFLSGVAAFWLPGFFERNLANLDQLNNSFGGLLLLLIPAITMGAWAEERKQGTEELLLTLPATEFELVMGKYLGCVAIYAVCLLFAAGHVLVLAFLGRPDPGLTLATYTGYFLAGASLIGVGLAASSVSASATISYITGALACGSLVSIGLLGTLLPGTLVGQAASAIAVPQRMESLARGVVDLADVAYFVGVALIGVSLAVAIVSRRRLAGSGELAGAIIHYPLRGAALIVTLACVVILLDRAAVRADATAERLWSMSAQTKAIIDGLPSDRPVIITAYVSPKVPESLVQQRESLLGLLREVQSRSRGVIQTRVIAAQPNSEEARQAERSFAIRPRPVPADPGAGAPGSVQEVFLAFAVSGGGGSEPSVVEFLSRGLSVEYELARSLRAATTTARKKVGVLDTPANLFGQFDFQTMRQGNDWPIINELRKQYEVVRISGAAPVPADIHVLLVAQPSSLKPEEMDNLIAYVRSGRPAAIFEDPMPIVNPMLATAEARRPGNPMMGGGQSEAKAGFTRLGEVLGVNVPSDAVVWDSANPHPQLSEVPPEFIWVNRLAARQSSSAQPGFNDADPIVSGLQECVLLFPGRIERLGSSSTPKPAGDKGGDATGAASETQVTPLLRSGPTSGRVAYSSILQRGPFGISGINPSRVPQRLNTQQVLGARITGKPAGTPPAPQGDAKQDGDKALNVVLVADLDMISETFFALRESGSREFEFDNVTFVLNTIDELAGERSLVDLRKRRREFRTLERIEARRRAETEATLTAINAAEAEAQSRLSEAQARFDARLKEIDSQKDLDDTTRQIMAEAVRQAETRKLDAQRREIEDQKKARIEDERLATRAKVEEIQMSVRIAAVTLPPVPALAVGLFVLVRRRTREQQLIAQTDSSRLAK